MTRIPALLLVISLALAAVAQVQACRAARASLEAQQVTAGAIQALAAVIREKNARDAAADHPPSP